MRLLFADSGSHSEIFHKVRQTSQIQVKASLLVIRETKLKFTDQVLEICIGSRFFDKKPSEIFGNKIRIWVSDWHPDHRESVHQRRGALPSLNGMSLEFQKGGTAAVESIQKEWNSNAQCRKESKSNRNYRDHIATDELILKVNQSDLLQSERISVFRVSRPVSD
jgi:hypothetical protein